MSGRIYPLLTRTTLRDLSTFAGPRQPVSHCASIWGNRRRFLETILVLVVLLGCGFALSACSGDFYDEEYSRLGEVLNDRWISDASIPSVSMGFDTDTFSGSRETWLAIELSYTKNCSEATDDPCEALADEMARIVFDQYARIDDLDGLRIIITNETAFGPVLASSPNSHLGIITGSTFARSSDHLVKSLTIEEWREDLSIREEG